MSAPRPVPRAETRLVFVDGKGRVYAPEQPITLGEAVWGRLQRMYEVDIKENPAQFPERLPCREKGFYFEVLFGLNWRVHDPAQIVRDGQSDVQHIYQPYLVGRLTEYSERFGIEERRGAEEQLNTVLGDRMVLRQGITISGCGVRLTLGAEAEEHLRERTRARFDTQTRNLEHGAALHDTALEKELLAARREIEMLKQDQGTEDELRGLRAKAEIDRLRQELERQDQRHQLELKSERLATYGRMLESGNYGALFLEANPDNAAALLELLLGLRRDDQNYALKTLSAMIDSDLLNAADVDEPRRAALAKILDGLSNSSADTIMGTRSTPAIAAPRDGRGPQHREDEDDLDDDE